MVLVSMTAHHDTTARTRGSRRRRRALFAAVACAIVGAVCFVVLEAGVRVFAPQDASWLAIYRRHPERPFYALNPDAHAVVDTGESRWEVFTDADGHRRGRQPRPSDAPVALWVGDSFTFGHGVDFEDGWVGRVEQATGDRLRHVNCGVAGYGPQQYEAILTDELSERDDVAVVIVGTFLGNDLHDTIWNKDLPVVNGIQGDPGGLRSWVKRNLHAYRLISNLYHQLTAQERPETVALNQLGDPDAWLEPPLADAIVNYGASMSNIARLCRERSVPLVILVVPTLKIVELYQSEGAPPETLVRDERWLLQRASGMLCDLDALLVDATPTLAAKANEQLYFRFDHHLTPRGNELVADLLLRTVPQLQR